jgi:hypothetical protein
MVPDTNTTGAAVKCLVVERLGGKFGGPKMRTDHCRSAGRIAMGAVSAVLVPVDTLPPPVAVDDLSFDREVAPRAFGEEILVLTLTLDARHGALPGANQFQPNMLGFACKCRSAFMQDWRNPSEHIPF